MNDMKRMDFRKKALAASMKDKGTMEALTRRKSPGLEDIADGEMDEQGFVQMMVSPEEKAQILKMRGHGGEEEMQAHEEMA